MTLSPNLFTRTVTQAGLARPRCGITAALALQRLLARPVPCKKKLSNSDAPSDEKSLGALIAAGLARLDKGKQEYIATQDGAGWIAQLTARGILSQNAA